MTNASSAQNLKGRRREDARIEAEVAVSAGAGGVVKGSTWSLIIQVYNRNGPRGEGATRKRTRLNATRPGDSAPSQSCPRSTTMLKSPNVRSLRRQFGWMMFPIPFAPLEPSRDLALFARRNRQKMHSLATHSKPNLGDILLRRASFRGRIPHSEPGKKQQPNLYLACPPVDGIGGVSPS